jgi:predicted peptidase
MKKRDEILLRILRMALIFAVLCPSALIVANYFIPFSPVIDRNSAYYRRPYFTTSFPFMIPYMLCVPDDYDPHKKYPLVLILHGAKKHSYEAGTLAGPTIQAKYEPFIFMPLAPFHQSWPLPQRPPFNDSTDNALPMAMDILYKIENDYSIDRSRIYISGYSVGGFGTYGALIQHPETFAAAIVASGGWIEDEAPQVSKIPIWIFHNSNDPQIPVNYARGMYLKLKSLGRDVKYTENIGTGHDTTNAYDKDELWAWLFTQHRNDASISQTAAGQPAAVK